MNGFPSPLKGKRLYKFEKLCSKNAVDGIFAHGQSAIAYPLRTAYRFRPAEDACARFLITVPKKKIRKAVDRVLLRRRIREAYRLTRREMLHPALLQAGIGVDIAFIYLDNENADFDTIKARMSTLLGRIAIAAEKHADA